MSYSLDHPGSKKLLGEVRLLFQKKKIFYALRTHVAFVCGGNGNRDLRPRFIGYVEHSKVNIGIFRAEDALADFFSDRDPEFINLVHLEKLIANVFDSVVIFPESPGSIAELGYFSHDRNIRKKTLIVNSDEHQDDSFLTIGPIAAVDRDSVFRSTIILSAKTKAPRFDLIVNRLMRFASKRRHREPFRFSSYSTMGAKDRLFILAEIINIFRVIDFAGLELCLKTAFGKVRRTELKKMLSILCAAHFVARYPRDPEYFVPGNKAKRFFEYDHYDINSLQAKIALYYKNHHPDSFAVLRRLP